uniref:EXPERA domain-containing protein n=1 Tax=Cairina moschata TaxID=8855 RepID=A0A8C3BK26_CAIMO
METAPAHPYWPRSLSLPGYVSSARPGWQCAGAVAAAFAALLALGWALGGAGGGARGGARRSPAQRLAVAWFLLCAAVHGGLEGYFSLRHRHLAADTGLLADIWQLYGDVLYFGTEWRAGWAHADPHPLYFWGYFVALNALWLLIPGALLLQAGLRLAAAQTAFDRPPHKAH